MFSDKDAYMTTEAAFVVPWVVFIIVWIIYLGYFQYDRCLLFTDNYSLATQAASRIDTTAGKQNWLDSHKTGWIGNKYMGTKHVACDAEADPGKIKITSSLKVSHPLSYHAKMIPSANWNISDEVNADNFSYPKRLRLFRAGERVLNGFG